MDDFALPIAHYKSTNMIKMFKWQNTFIYTYLKIRISEIYNTVNKLVNTLNKEEKIYKTNVLLIQQCVMWQASFLSTLAFSSAFQKFLVHTDTLENA